MIRVAIGVNMATGRKISTIEQLNPKIEKLEKKVGKSQGRSAYSPKSPADAPKPNPVEEQLVSLNFPSPTSISKVLMELSHQFHFTFVMEPSLNRKVQIFSPKPVPRKEALNIVVASLSAVGLRLVAMGSGTYKISKKQPIKKLV